MNNLPNIELSRFTHGAYVGYAAGAVWSITKGTREWIAIPRQADSPDAVRNLRLRAPTLTALSAALAEV